MKRIVCVILFLALIIILLVLPDKQFRKVMRIPPESDVTVEQPCK